MKRTELLNRLSIFMAPIITVFVYVTGFSIVDFLLKFKSINYILNKSFIDRLYEPSTKIAIDIAILTIISMLLIRAIDLIKIKVNIVNNDRTGELYIKNRDRKSKILEFTFDINFNSIILKKFIDKLGTLKLKIYKPNGVKVIIKNKMDFNQHVIDDTSDISYITIDMLRILDRGVFANEVYLLIEIEAENIIHDLNRQITTELIVEGKGTVRGILLYFVRGFIVNAEMDKHYIRIRR